MPVSSSNSALAVPPPNVGLMSCPEVCRAASWRTKGMGSALSSTPSRIGSHIDSAM